LCKEQAWKWKEEEEEEEIEEDLIPFVAYKEVLIPFSLPNCCELLT
jgi:hypothetical protein